MDKKLSQMNRSAHRGDRAPLTETQIEAMMARVPGWDVLEEDGAKRLKRTYTFRDFASALDFANKVGAIAEEQGHHPVITLTWGRATVAWPTHKINGLHENDFIMAAKTDELRPLG